MPRCSCGRFLFTLFAGSPQQFVQILAHRIQSELPVGRRNGSVQEMVVRPNIINLIVAPAWELEPGHRVERRRFEKKGGRTTFHGH